MAAIARTEKEFGLPCPTIGGEWAKSSPETRKGYWLVDASTLLTSPGLDKMIEYAVASGLPYLVIEGWAESSGHYNVSQSVGGLGGLVSRAIISEIWMRSFPNVSNLRTGNPVKHAALARFTVRLTHDER